jgi:uncharacterized protein
MINNIFVIDAVTHTFNFRDDNVMPGRLGASLREMLMGGLYYGAGPGDAGGPGKLRLDRYKFDWEIYQLANAQFLVSDTDIGVHHTLPLWSWFKDGAAPHSKTVEAITKYPTRFLGYAAVDPTAGIDQAMRLFDQQMDEVPAEARDNLVGLKLYPAQADPLSTLGYRSFRMDDPEIAFPLFRRALDYGLKTVAIHKAAPLGLVPMNPYRVDDVSGAAAAFPDLSFEIVHAGMAFNQETAMAMAQYPNIYAHLEMTAALVLSSPKAFEEIMAEMIFWAGPEKILYGTAGNFFGRGQHILEAFSTFQFSDETCAGWGISKLTDRDRRLIMGENYARIVGLDIEQAKKRIAEDDFEAVKNARGRQPHLTTWSLPEDTSNGDDAQ